MNRFKFTLSILAAAVIGGLAGVVFAGVGYPVIVASWLGDGAKRNTVQFQIRIPSSGSSAQFVPGTDNTNALGTSSLRFSDVRSVLATFSGNTMVTPATAQTIDSGGTVTADGCGAMKRITSADPVTTDTTNTFTAPASANTGCIMYLVNVGTNTITLDTNALFVSAGAANVAVTANDTLIVGSDGSKWYQLSALLAN